jgi:hypothetical protein
LSRIASPTSRTPVAAHRSCGLDRIMDASQIRRLGRSLRSLVVPVLVFVVCLHTFEILLMKHV